jgi:fluoroquinolone transport system permease protein
MTMHGPHQCMAGIYLVCYTNDFMSFILRSIPILIVFLNLPLLNYFKITDSILIKITPASGSLDLIINSYGNSSDSQIAAGYLSLVVWLPLLHLLVYRRFNKTMVKS